jgi:hypothetical protein
MLQATATTHPKMRTNRATRHEEASLSIRAFPLLLNVWFDA